MNWFPIMVIFGLVALYNVTRFQGFRRFLAAISLACSLLWFVLHFAKL